MREESEVGGDISKNLKYINIAENISAMLMYCNLSVLSSMIIEAGAPWLTLSMFDNKG